MHAVGVLQQKRLASRQLGMLIDYIRVSDKWEKNRKFVKKTRSVVTNAPKVSVTQIQVSSEAKKAYVCICHSVSKKKSFLWAHSDMADNK